MAKVAAVFCLIKTKKKLKVQKVLAEKMVILYYLANIIIFYNLKKKMNKLFNNQKNGLSCLIILDPTLYFTKELPYIPSKICSCI